MQITLGHTYPTAVASVVADPKHNDERIVTQVSRALSARISSHEVLTLCGTR
jgi:hypothetical protein